MSIATLVLGGLLIASWVWFALMVDRRLGQIAGYLALLNGRDWDREKREIGVEHRDISRFSDETRDY